MSEPEDHSSTRPISVAELLAKNGSIGAPPVGGRRRRRRGDSSSVTVAELTGEIPIVTDGTEGDSADTTLLDDPVEQEGFAQPQAGAPRPSERPREDGAREDHAATNGASHDTVVQRTEAESAPEPQAPVGESVGPDQHLREHTAETLEFDEDFFKVAQDGRSRERAVPEADLGSAAELEYAAHLEQRDSDDDPVEFAAPRRIPPASPFSGHKGGAEQMSPDPVGDDHDDGFASTDLLDSLEGRTNGDISDLDTMRVPSYLRSSSDTLFGGQSVADDMARRGVQPGPEDIDLGEDTRPDGDELDEPREPMSPLLRGFWVVVQCILAVAFGAGLFIAFDLLWKWEEIVALVLSVLVILGLVVGVRVVRKTEDIGSTLIAVAVGALVTLGPLALMQSH